MSYEFVMNFKGYQKFYPYKHTTIKRAVLSGVYAYNSRIRYSCEKVVISH